MANPSRKVDRLGKLLYVGAVFVWFIFSNAVVLALVKFNWLSNMAEFSNDDYITILYWVGLVGMIAITNIVGPIYLMLTAMKGDQSE